MLFQYFILAYWLKLPHVKPLGQVIIYHGAGGVGGRYGSSIYVTPLLASAVL